MGTTNCMRKFEGKSRKNSQVPLQYQQSICLACLITIPTATVEQQPKQAMGARSAVVETQTIAELAVDRMKECSVTLPMEPIDLATVAKQACSTTLQRVLHVVVMPELECSAISRMVQIVLLAVVELVCLIILVTRRLVLATMRACSTTPELLRPGLAGELVCLIIQEMETRILKPESMVRKRRE